MRFKILFQNKTNILAAHRGARSIAPENTLLAFKKAIKLKADFIELDVGFSKDGIAIVIHDDTLNITTNAVEVFGEGEHRVIDYTYEEIRKLNANYEFLTKDPFGFIKKSGLKKIYIPFQTVPSLYMILALCKKENMPLNIEIKDMRNTPFNNVAVDRVLKLIEQTDMQDMVLISSFNHNYLKEIKAKSKIPIAPLQEGKPLKNPIEYLKKLDAFAYHCEAKLANKALIEALKQEGIWTNVFTVNDKKEQKRLFEMGVKAIFTDDW